jgi:hypothetical protein
VAGVTGALGLALLLGAGAAHAAVDITIADARVPEGNSMTFQPRPFTVQLSGPPPSEVRVSWQLVAGSAKDGAAPPDNDFIMASGQLVFPALGDGTEDINVQINGDVLNEWSPTDQQDQVFFIELSSPINGTIQRGRAMIVLLDDDRPNPGLQYVSAAANGISGSGTVTLHWRVPAPKPDDILVRWNQGAGGCTSPLTYNEGVTGGQFYLGPGNVNNPGTRQTFTHTGRANGEKHCYSLFSVFGGTHATGGEVAKVSVTPRDRNAGPIKWTYATRAPSLVPSTVGTDAIYHVDQDGVVHAMQRSESGGAWPTSWNPVGLGKPAQTRSPVVPFPDGWRLFVGTDGGGIHAIDARDGRIVWSRSTAFGNALPSLGFAQAPPALLLSAYGGNNDMLLVGTNNGGTSSFYAINPKTGIDQAGSPITGLLGDITGMAAVEYPARVFFLTSSSSASIYALNLGSPGTPTLTGATLPTGNPVALGSGSPLSPVRRSNRIFFGDSNGDVHGYDIVSGATHAPWSTGDGQVKGFMWPDRRNFNFYFSTDSKVRGIQDDGGAFSELPWSPITSTTHPSVTSPSILLQMPGTDFLYFGNNQGQLVQVDLSGGTPVVRTVQLEPPGTVTIGAPSLDTGGNLVIVGSATGTIYAVHVPF